jgi:hypothetical protein
MENKVAACRRATAAGDGAAAVHCLTLAWAGLRLTGPLRLVDTLAGTLRALAGLDAEQRLVWSGCRHRPASPPARWPTPCVPANGAGARRRLSGGAGDTDVDHRREVAAAQGLVDHANRCFDSATALAEGAGIDAASRCHLLNARAFPPRMAAATKTRAPCTSGRWRCRAGRDRRWQGGVLGTWACSPFARPARRIHRLRARARAERCLRRQALGRQHALQSRRGLSRHGEGRRGRAQLLAARDIGRAVGNLAIESAAECNLGIASMVAATGPYGQGLLHLRQAVTIATTADDLRTASQAAALPGLRPVPGGRPGGRRQGARAVPPRQCRTGR